VGVRPRLRGGGDGRGGGGGRAAARKPLHLNPFAAAFVLAVVAIIGIVSMRRANEDTFLLCLGFGRARQAAMFTAPALAAELALLVFAFA